MSRCLLRVTFLFFNDTATTEIYTLSLHDALPISIVADVGTVLGGDDDGLDRVRLAVHVADRDLRLSIRPQVVGADRKSTRLNSSHVEISYAVFCLKKKKLPASVSFNRSLCLNMCT